MTFFKKQLKKISDSGYLRKRILVDDTETSRLKIEKNQVISFASNDYLGMSKNTEVVKELNNSANKYGVGSGSSPLISGYSKSSHFLEKEISEYLDAESCVVLNSGYLANICLLNIFDNEMNVIQDKESHNSIIESSKINKIKLSRYKHLDNKHLESYLEKKKNQILFSESVFSMSGDLTNIKQHYAIKKKYGAYLFVDDAHGFAIAKSSRNITPLENSCSMFDVKPSSVDAYMGTFGKAVGTIWMMGTPSVCGEFV